MSEYSIKSIRKKFSDNGVFYTDRALAEKLKSYMPADVTEVYDPTCGNGALLAVFGDDVAKFGQELDPVQAQEASLLPNAHIVTGDTLKNPAFLDKRFRAILGNPPFSAKWDPNPDVRFEAAPALAPPSRADWAFLLHIIHYLADDGVAAVLNSPGVGFRENKEAKIRQWVIEQGYIHESHLVEGGHFADTNIATLLLIIRKIPAKEILFEDCATGRKRIVSIGEVKEKGYKLTPDIYMPIVEREGEKPRYRPILAEIERRRSFIDILKAEIQFSKLNESTCGLSVEPFLSAIIQEANNQRKQPSLFV